MDNHFNLLGFTPSMKLDIVALEQAWKKASLHVHPDRFATASPAEKRIALQWASNINEAYTALKDPLSRATYLCMLNGFDIEAENNTAMPPAFLMKQMQWREDYDDFKASKDAHAIQSLLVDIQAEQTQYEQSIQTLIDEQQDYTEACGKIREWMFIRKLNQSFKPL